MFGLGATELIAIGAVLFVFFGAKRLPQLGSSLAEGIRNFQKGLGGKSDEGPNEKIGPSDPSASSEKEEEEEDPPLPKG